MRISKFILVGAVVGIMCVFTACGATKPVETTETTTASYIEETTKKTSVEKATEKPTKTTKAVKEKATKAEEKETTTQAAEPQTEVPLETQSEPETQADIYVEPETVYEEPIVDEPDSTQEYVEQNYTEYAPTDLLYNGVIYWGNWKFTYYSENVLPGDGLNIPGRWSDGNFVRDESGFICVASSDLAWGTVVDTPWGVAKVYDCGCDSGVIDVYVSW